MTASLIDKHILQYSNLISLLTCRLQCCCCAVIFLSSEVHPLPQYLTRGQIHSPWLGDIVDSGTGMSYRPANSISPQSGSKTLYRVDKNMNEKRRPCLFFAVVRNSPPPLPFSTCSTAVMGTFIYLFPLCPAGRGLLCLFWLAGASEAGPLQRRPKWRGFSF